uniref:Uncharacterized protein n=1 Tax=Oryza punctata TaxID=4537 RepID=A0A0E0ML39_ORYPU
MGRGPLTGALPLLSPSRVARRWRRPAGAGELAAGPGEVAAGAEAPSSSAAWVRWRLAQRPARQDGDDGGGGGGLDLARLLSPGGPPPFPSPPLTRRGVVAGTARWRRGHQISRRFDSIICFDLSDQQTRAEIAAQYAKHLTKSELFQFSLATEEKYYVSYNLFFWGFKTIGASSCKEPTPM